MKKSRSFKELPIHWTNKKQEKNRIVYTPNYYFNKDDEAVEVEVSDCEEIFKLEEQVFEDYINDITAIKDTKNDIRDKMLQFTKIINKPLPPPLVEPFLLKQNELGLVSDETIRLIVNNFLENIED
jgi:hypothetical protein